MSIGALLGSAVASITFMVSGQSYVTTFAAAAIPPFLAFLWLTLTFQGDLKATSAGHGDAASVARPTTSGAASAADRAVTVPSLSAPDSDKAQPKLGWLQRGVKLVKAFAPGYWQALLVVSILYFGRFDFGWVVLRAQAVRTLSSPSPIVALCRMSCDASWIEVGSMCLVTLPNMCSSAWDAYLSFGMPR
jgi:hypothetical protein